jgi:cell division septation protein DedD
MREMKNREFREIQVSSSLLVVIFLAVLALGIFVFLLGVSVGKKQVRVAGDSQVAAQTVRESAAALAAEKPGGEQSQIAAGGEVSAPPKVEAKSKSPAASKPVPAPGSGLYYVQVGAFLEKKQALDLAETYRKQGYTVVVTDPRPDDRQTWHRVRLGGFASRERAEDLLKGLNAAAGRKTDFRVVRD